MRRIQAERAEVERTANHRIVLAVYDAAGRRTEIAFRWSRLANAVAHALIGITRRA